MEQSKNREERTNPCETDEFRGRGLRRYIYIYMVKGEAGIWVIKHGAGGYFRFLAEKISGITICKSYNIKITTGICLS